MSTINTSYTYLLLNGRNGPSKALTSGDNGFGRFAFMRDVGNTPDQQWFFIKTHYPYTYRMHTLALGPAFSLDVLNTRGINSSQLRFSVTAGITSQLWTFMPAIDIVSTDLNSTTSLFRLTNDFTGLDRPLGAFQSGPFARLVDSDIGVEDAQIWTFSRLTTDTQLSQYAKETPSIDPPTPTPPPVASTTAEQNSTTAATAPAGGAPAATVTASSIPLPTPAGNTLAPNLGFPVQPINISFPNPNLTPGADDPNIDLDGPDYKPPEEDSPQSSPPQRPSNNTNLLPNSPISAAERPIAPSNSEPNLSPSPTTNRPAMSSAAVAGIALGLVVLLALCTAGFLFRRAYKRRRKEEEDGVPWTLVSRPSSGGEGMMAGKEETMAGLSSLPSSSPTPSEKSELRERVRRFLGITRTPMAPEFRRDWHYGTDSGVVGTGHRSQFDAEEEEEEHRKKEEMNMLRENPFVDPPPELAQPKRSLKQNPLRQNPFQDPLRPGTSGSGGQRLESGEKGSGVLVIKSVNARYSDSS